jgi:hypothetical protein
MSLKEYIAARVAGQDERELEPLAASLQNAG